MHFARLRYKTICGIIRKRSKGKSTIVDEWYGFCINAAWGEDSGSVVRPGSW